MSDINVWSKVQVAVQTVLAAPKTITSISKANPAIAVIATSGYAANDIILLKVVGMRQLNFRVVRVDAVATDDVTLEGIDSTLYDTFVSGTAEKLTFGANAATLQDVNASGGEAEAILIKTIHDDQDFEIPGNRNPLNMSFGSLWVPNDAALVALAAFDEIKSPCAIEIRFATGAKVYYLCYPSVSMAPTGTAGGPVTTPVTFRVRGRLTTYAS